MQEATLAKEKMHGKLVCNRPLVVRLASEKYLLETTENSGKSVVGAKKTNVVGSCSGHTSRSAKIAAIKAKLKAMEEESQGLKKQKLANSVSGINSLDPSSVKK